MKTADFELAFDQGLYDDEYMDFIMEHANPEERLICNGDDLLAAFEDMYLYDEFKDSKVTEVY